MVAPAFPPPRGSIRSWRSRFKAAVRDRFFVRFHMAIILTGVATTGIIANRLLYRAGVQAMEARYPLAVAVAYLAFFIGVWLWIAYIHAATPRSLLEPVLAAPLLSAAPTSTATQRRENGAQSRLEVEDCADVADLAVEGIGAVPDGVDGIDEGILWLLLIALVAILVFAGGWLVWQAPAILSEAAFSAALAGALRRSARQEDQPHWGWHVFRKSIVPFLVVALIGAGCGYAARWFCPSARTVYGALHCDPAMVELLSE